MSAAHSQERPEQGPSNNRLQLTAGTGKMNAGRSLLTVRVLI